MAQISVENLTFAYEGSFDEVFTDTSFSIDTDWKLGFIGRNGKGKTTFLNLLLGKFEKNMEQYSEGQKKKVLIASSLLTHAHLYIWDEPLNYIDVYTRMQIEKLILAFKPTMLLVEHDVRFKENIATSVFRMDENK